MSQTSPLYARLGGEHADRLFAMALGGPVSYSGRPIGHVHHGRGITAHHFGRFVGCLVQTLEDLGISEAESDAVIDRINSYANEVTGTSY